MEFQIMTTYCTTELQTLKDRYNELYREYDDDIKIDYLKQLIEHKNIDPELEGFINTQIIYMPRYHLFENDVDTLTFMCEHLDAVITAREYIYDKFQDSDGSCISDNTRLVLSYLESNVLLKIDMIKACEYSLHRHKDPVLTYLYRINYLTKLIMNDTAIEYDIWINCKEVKFLYKSDLHKSLNQILKTHKSDKQSVTVKNDIKSAITDILTHLTLLKTHLCSNSLEKYLFKMALSEVIEHIIVLNERMILLWNN